MPFLSLLELISDAANCFVVLNTSQFCRAWIPEASTITRLDLKSAPASPMASSSQSMRCALPPATPQNWGDDGTNDLLVSQVLRTNEFRVCFLSEHLVKMPLVIAK